MATFAFNPMTQPFWMKFDLLTRTDILCGANGLTYGTDYGQGFYSSSNAGITHHTLKTFPHVSTFRELAECIGNVITTGKKHELNPDIRRAGVHVHEVMKRLPFFQHTRNCSRGTPYHSPVKGAAGGHHRGRFLAAELAFCHGLTSICALDGDSAVRKQGLLCCTCRPDAGLGSRIGARGTGQTRTMPHRKSAVNAGVTASFAVCAALAFGNGGVASAVPDGPGQPQQSASEALPASAVPRNETAGTPLARLVFSRSYVPGSRDARGNFMGGTEAMWLAGHDGKLFAAIGYASDQPGSDPRPGAQILCKEAPDAPWQVDHQFDAGCLRVEGLISFAFTTDYRGRKLPQPVRRLVASPSELQRSSMI
jgi:hypothetical protein